MSAVMCIPVKKLQTAAFDRDESQSLSHRLKRRNAAKTVSSINTRRWCSTATVASCHSLQQFLTISAFLCEQVDVAALQRQAGFQQQQATLQLVRFGNCRVIFQYQRASCSTKPVKLAIARCRPYRVPCARYSPPRRRRGWRKACVGWVCQSFSFEGRWRKASQNQSLAVKTSSLHFYPLLTRTSIKLPGRHCHDYPLPLRHGSQLNLASTRFFSILAPVAAATIFSGRGAIPHRR